MPHDIAPTGTAHEIASLLHWNEQGLIPVIAQQHDTGEVLMFAWATREAVEKTAPTATATACCISSMPPVRPATSCAARASAIASMAMAAYTATSR
jgi:hypothetical protein